MGSGLGAATLVVDTPLVYRATILLGAATFLIAAAIAIKLPRLEPARERHTKGPGMLTVFRDPPCVVVVLLSTVLAMHFAIIEVGREPIRTCRHRRRGPGVTTRDCRTLALVSVHD